ncbi:hypothetical protein GIB67_034997 [Kingdonia uniflora]|uniref:Anthocyanin acyltransferase n=1 Tax=Kingdonia uniflora TaxID=39325 RepID=A0A7J7NGY1_9MAGN|nr:hypothetical protein GIB67_034997 [Kingdonia uniflora]
MFKDPNGIETFLEKIKITRQCLMVHGNHHKIPTDLVQATFLICQPEIERLKRWILTQILEKDTQLKEASFNLSSFVVTCAYVWVCFVKTLGGHYDDNLREHCFFAVECRSRLNPALPENYFGNCLVPCLTFANKEDLLGKDGIVVAAEVIGKGIQMSIKGVSEEGFQGDLAKCSSTTLEHVSGIAGSPKWKFYETDFGWGRPKKVELCSIHRAKAVIFSERSDGEAGIEIGVILNKIDMDAFEMNFADTIKTY